MRTGGLANGKPAVLLVMFRQPGANIIETVDRVRALLPQLRAVDPARRSISTVVLDRTTTIRASVHDVQFTLLLSIVPGDSGGLRLPAQTCGRRSSPAWPCRCR